MRKEGALFPQSFPDDHVKKTVNVVVDALWYIDGTKHKFAERSRTHHVDSFPKRFAVFIKHQQM
jgi:hypothetical protein